MVRSFDFDITAGIAQFQAGLTQIQQENLPFVLAHALTKTASDIRPAEIEKMAEVFDRPTRFTLNALQVVPATKQDLRSAVTFKQGFGSIPAQRYLGPEVEGGGRVHKSHERAMISAGIMRQGEYAVPGQGVRLDAHGNVPGATFVRILSQLQASRDPQQNMTTRSRRRAVKRAGGRYLLIRNTPNAPDGIYFRAGAGDIVPVLLFVRPPSYSKRFPFFETAQHVVGRRLGVHFAEAMRRYGNSRKPV